jgi:hypothetical protein
MEFGFDIDGILTREVEGHDYANRTVNETNVATLSLLHAEGHLITVYTARMDIDWLTTQEWLKEQGIPFHRVVMGKPKCDAYVCDMTVSDPDLLLWLRPEAIQECWKVKQGQPLQRFCSNMIENMRHMPLLDRITFVRCMAACRTKVLTEPVVSGPVNISIVQLFKHAMNVCANNDRTRI